MTAFFWKKVLLDGCRTLVAVLVAGLTVYLTDLPPEAGAGVAVILSAILRGLQALYTRLETPPSQMPPPQPPSSTA